MIHGGDWASFDAFTRSQQDLLDLSSSISPYGPGPKARALWPSLVDRLHRYPDWRKGELTQVLAEHLGVTTDSILVTAGAMEAIDLVLRTFQPQRVSVEVPAFSEYAARSLVYGIDVRTWHHPAELRPEPGLLFLANPGNPQGRVLQPRECRQYLKGVSESRHILVVDEAFIEFVDSWREWSLVRDAAKSDRLVVMGSLTKFYGLAGLRIGFLVSHPQIIRKLAAWTIPWHVSLIAQEMACASLQDQDYFDLARIRLNQERGRLAMLLRPFGRVDESSRANYFLFYPHLSVDEFIKSLQKQGILVRDARNFEGLTSSGVRMAVKKPKDSMRLVHAMENIFQGGRL